MYYWLVGTKDLSVFLNTANKCNTRKIAQNCRLDWNAIHVLICISSSPLLFLQMSMGTCYGVVPYVDNANTGSVAGIVGAGGNVGAAILGLFFIKYEYDAAMEYMGWFTIAMGLLTPLVVIKGYSGILFGKDDHEDASRKQHSPLRVPKMQHSPHLVKLRQKRRTFGH
jgi:nitrate/nitrite transporter NarK